MWLRWPLLGLNEWRWRQRSTSGGNLEFLSFECCWRLICLSDRFNLFMHNINLHMRLKTVRRRWVFHRTIAHNGLFLLSCIPGGQIPSKESCGTWEKETTYSLFYFYTRSFRSSAVSHFKTKPHQFIEKHFNSERKSPRFTVIHISFLFFFLKEKCY